MGNPDNNECWIGFDLGGTKQVALVFDRDFKVIGREKKKTRSQESSGSGLDRIARTIRTALEQANRSGQRPSGIGLGAPGALDLDKGLIIDAPNLGWKNIALRDFLRKEFSCPVEILNDVDAGIYGEYELGAAKNARCALGVFPGTGIGGGCVYNGYLLRGKTTSCMEIGHFPMVPDGLLCGCGRKGCLETVASRLAIAAAASVAVFRGDAPNLAKIAGTDLAAIRSSTLAESIRAGDKAVEIIVRQAAQWLGRALAGVINLMAPDIVVLGGGLVEAMPSIYLEEVGATSKELVIPGFRNIYKLVTAKLGDDATAIGAASWTRNTLAHKA